MSNLIDKVWKPIFIIGAGRSGTTMLFDLLSTHPGLIRTNGYPDGEDHDGWIKHGKCVMAGIGNSRNSAYGSGINGYQFCLHMTAEDVTEEIVSAMHHYYWHEVLSGKNKQRVINKQPHLSNKLKYVAAIFRDAKFIHIIRDCEPMVASWLSIMKEHPTLEVYWPFEERFPCVWLMPKPTDAVALRVLKRHTGFFPGGGAGMWADYWCKINQGILEQSTGLEEQLITVRYEDLVDKSRRVVDRLLDFCELPNFDFSFDHFQRDTKLKHQHLISEDLRQAISDRSGDVRKLFGYESGAVELARSLFVP